VTMVPAELSAHGAAGRDWVCLECEEEGDGLGRLDEDAP
jgi:hypothetical protein